jgi:hypothetical protein
MLTAEMHQLHDHRAVKEASMQRGPLRADSGMLAATLQSVAKLTK